MLRLGTRASPLAKWQADWVAAQLRGLGVEVDLVLISTAGDQQGASPGPIAGTGIFTKEIERELLAGRIDLAVHSLKDLPTEVAPGLTLAAIPPRGPVGDVLVSAAGASLAGLPPGALVGTGSLRRRAQLLHVRGDLQMRDLRGNVETRLRKLHQGQYQAIVLAAAGLARLGLADEPAWSLPLEVVLPAVGQAALAVESRAADQAVLAAAAPLDDAATRAAVTAERAMLAALQGGCLAPVAAWARIENQALTLAGRVLSPDGARRLEAAHTAPAGQAETLGRQVAEALLAQGAAELIAAARQT